MSYHARPVIIDKFEEAGRGKQSVCSNCATIVVRRDTQNHGHWYWGERIRLHILAHGNRVGWKHSVQRIFRIEMWVKVRSAGPMMKRAFALSGTGDVDCWPLAHLGG
jgi:hypothetical protein